MSETPTTPAPEAPEANPSASTEPAPPAATAPSEPAGTSWELVKKMKADGVPREEMLARLKATGLDDESATVLINSVAGAMPVELPNAQLSPGTNILSPNTFAISDIGLTGPPTTVGLYWMGFGAAILIALGVGFILTQTLERPLPEDFGFYALRIGGFVSMCCVAWGVYRYSQGITIRRK